MTTELVSGWTEGRNVYLVENKGTAPRIRRLPAKWSFFAKGLDESDRKAVARDPGVIAVEHDDPYTRINCRDRKARKAIQETLRDAARENDNDELEILEGDVNPLRRLLSDVSTLDVSPNPRLAYIDIETDSRKTFDQMKEGKARILSIVGTDAEEREFFRWVIDGDDNVSEREMLSHFFDALWPFDVVIAWNGDGFDFPVIQNRTEKLKVSTLEGNEILWHRWCWLDHLEVFKKYNMHSDGGGEEKTSFKLDHVAHYLLGEGKDDFDASKTWEAWDEGGEERQRLLEYNAKDTKLLPRIEKATGFLSLHLAVCHICRVFPDTFSLNATAQGDGFLLRLGDEYGYRWPTKGRPNDDEAKFAGAFVMEPTRTGAVDDVHVADFSGLYPSIMRTFNMSFDTKVTGAEKKRLERKATRQIEEGPSVFARMNPVAPEGVCQLPERYTWFRTDRDGMFRIALDRLVAKRGEYQKAQGEATPGTEEWEHYKRLSGAFKIVANSFYGITGSPWSRFYDVDISEGVTQTGKWLLQQVIKGAKAKGLDPFYGDTDSVFVQGVAEVFSKLVDELNDKWGELLEPWGITGEHYIKLAFEKSFARCVLISAKRYAAKLSWYKGKEADPDAKPEVKGLEFKRGDTIRLARDMQYEIVMMLLRPDLPEPDEIRDVVAKWKQRILKGDLELEEVVLTQSLSKPLEEYVDRFTTAKCKGCAHEFEDGTDAKGPDECPECGQKRKRSTAPMHVRVARKMKETGDPIGEGSRVPYLVIVNGEGNREPVPVSAGALEKIDREYYWDRVYKASMRVLEKVYPEDRWNETAAEKKARLKAEATERNRGKVSDLPLFSANGVEDARPSVDPGKPKPRRRRRKKRRVNPVDTKSEQEPLRPRKRRRKRPRAPEPEPASEDPRPRRRRRKKASGNRVTLTIVENSPEEDGGAERPRRRRLLEAIRAAIEAHPGDLPVDVVIMWRDCFKSADKRDEMTVRAKIPTGLAIDKTTDARRALERLVKTEHVKWPVAR